jgi:hypothetical protein
MNALFLLLALAAAEARPVFTSPKDPQPEYGHGLAADDAGAGWISLFDGATAFGWSGGKVEDRKLVGGTTTGVFGPCEVRISTDAEGDLVVGAEEKAVHFPTGQSTHELRQLRPGLIRLGPTLRVRKLALRPLGLRSLLAAPENQSPPWTIIKHPSVPMERQAKWQDAASPKGLHAVGGPGAVQLRGAYGDFILQAKVKTVAPLSNAGIFFRCREGDFLNGYEGQIFNGCYGGDPARPARYATGAIDDRQNARRLVSRDSEPFTMTIIAAGPHIATWVNGVQVTDWTDERPRNDNARNGLRLKPGPIQLQAHERSTDVVFENIRIFSMDPR